MPIISQYIYDREDHIYKAWLLCDKMAYLHTLIIVFYSLYLVSKSA